MDEQYKLVYTLKQNDSTLIGDVYVKFENDTIFRHLYVMNNKDTLYSIKKNLFFNKNGAIDDAGRADIYGYTFSIKGNDHFYMNIWDKYNKSIIEYPIYMEWDYDDNIMRVVLP